MRIALTFAAVLFPTVALAQGQPQCSELGSEVTLGPLSGRRIDSVLVETANPDLGRFAGIVGRMHVRTRPEVVRRELLFAPGDTVDTLRVAESLRRLRKLPFLEYAHIESRRCAAPSGESLTLNVATRDTWTTRPDIKASRSSPRFGMTERNLLGTGSTVFLGLVSRNGSLGVGASAFDAFGFGSGMTTRAQFQQYSDGTIRALSVRRRQASVADRWRSELDLYNQRYEPTAPLTDNFERTGGDLIGGVRVTPSSSGRVLYLLGGVESDYSSLAAAQNADVVGPVRLDRRFTGPQVGISMASALYDTLTWLLPGGAVVDVPRMVEGEVVVGVGRGSVTSLDTSGPMEINRSNFMTHYDGWLGREWLPTSRSLMVGDIWASGYTGAGGWRSSRTRAAVSAEHAASAGVWRISAAGERLIDPDPDVRALAIYDRTLAFLPRRVRLAESAFSVSAERTRHLRSVGTALELDASIFGAFSKRWDPAATASPSKEFTAGVAGLGLALVPRRPGRGTIRLDYGFPVTPTPGIKRKPRFSISVLPWLESSRHRDKSGLY
jgi:hypothetical protein